MKKYHCADPPSNSSTHSSYNHLEVVLACLVYEGAAGLHLVRRLAVHGYAGVGGGTRQQQQHAYTTLEEAEIRLKITVGRRSFVTYYLGIEG